MCFHIDNFATNAFTLDVQSSGYLAMLVKGDTHDEGVMVTDARPLLVLVIDADSAARATVREAAQHLHWQLVEAADGLSGIELLRRYDHEIDLVVLAMELPDLDGYDTCLRLRAITRHRSVPLAILPIARSAEGESFLAALGCSPTVLKPVSVDDLTQALREAPSQTKQPTVPVALLSYAFGKANATEQIVRRQRVNQPRVVLFAQAHLVRSGVAHVLREQGAMVVLETDSVQAITTALTYAADRILACDAESSQVASVIAHEYGVPLLVVAVIEHQRHLLLRDASLLDGADGVVDISTDQTLGKLAEACAALLAGKRFFSLQATKDETDVASIVPAHVLSQFAQTSLTARAIEILWLDAHGWSSGAIARRLTIAEDSVQSHWKRMQRKMRQTRAELRSWFRRKLSDAQLRDIYTGRS